MLHYLVYWVRPDRPPMIAAVDSSLDAAMGSAALEAQRAIDTCVGCGAARYTASVYIVPVHGSDTPAISKVADMPPRSFFMRLDIDFLE